MKSELCSDVSKTSAVSFTVDLGEVALVSGFQSQGPPRSKGTHLNDVYTELVPEMQTYKGIYSLDHL